MQIAQKNVSKAIASLLTAARKQKTKDSWKKERARRVAFPLEEQLKSIIVGQRMVCSV
jgi:hypothetical protein